ncbi:MAG: phosphatase PAP2 family protein [Bacteroidaceae bacterium]|nr:phosphatase PAP2 family protein [Bacteroidaceae bacterium]
MKEHHRLLTTARILSSIFRPHYYPMVGMLLLLTCSYLVLYPIGLKLRLLAIVYLLTIGLPHLLIYLYRRLRGWSREELRHQHRRTVPYCIHIACYIFCIYVMEWICAPSFVRAMFAICLAVQLVCVFINIWWNISMHSAGAGALIGALIAYSALFHFNPVWWLCLTILISGLVNSSRMLLRQHTLAQVLAGTWVGVACGVLGILYF